MLSASVLSPKEELSLKKKELSFLQLELTEKELSLSTLKGEIHQFEKRYNQTVGSKYVELDEVRAQILDLSSRLDPQKEDLRQEAEAAREHAQQTSEETSWAEDKPTSNKGFFPTDALKKLFRKAAKKIHPDLATDLQDRERRHRLMAELNQAYDDLCEIRIREIIEEWEDKSESEKSAAIGIQLVRCIRKISQIKARLEEIQIEWNDLENSDMFQLKEHIENESQKGRDIIQEMINDIDERIIRVKTRVRKLAEGLAYL